MTLHNGDRVRVGSFEGLRGVVYRCVKRDGSGAYFKVKLETGAWVGEAMRRGRIRKRSRVEDSQNQSFPMKVVLAEDEKWVVGEEVVVTEPLDVERLTIRKLRHDVE